MLHYIVWLIGHCIATPQLVSNSVSFTRYRNTAYHVKIQRPISGTIVMYIFNSLLLMSLSLALAGKLTISSLLTGSLLASASESGIKSN